MSLEQELRDGAAELIKLADDLKFGRAREVPQEFGHVYRHFWNEQKAPSAFTKGGVEIAMIQREECVDFLKLWGIWYYIATCPRTGIRFVEGVKR